MLIKASRFYGIGLTLLVAGAIAACSSDGTPSGGTAGSTSQAGTGGSGTGGSGTAGSGTAGSGTAGSGTAGSGGATGNACAGMKPTAPLITQFDDLVANPTSAGQLMFMLGVPGGTFSYQPAALTVTDSSKSLNIKGNVHAYDGFGVYLNACADASMFTGVSFNIKGKPGPTGKLSFRIQTNSNTAIDNANKKGTCVVPAGTADPYPICHAAAFDIPVTEAGAVVEVKFSQLTGGVPIDGVNGKDIVGLEWAFPWMEGGFPAGGSGAGGSGGAAAGGGGGAGGAAAGSGSGGAAGASAGSGGAAGASAGSGGAAPAGGYDADITIDDIKFTGGSSGGTGAGGTASGGSGGTGGAAGGSGGAAAGGGGAGGSGGAKGGSGGAGGTQ